MKNEIKKFKNFNVFLKVSFKIGDKVVFMVVLWLGVFS